MFMFVIVGQDCKTSPPGFQYNIYVAGTNVDSFTKQVCMTSVFLFCTFSHNFLIKKVSK